MNKTYFKYEGILSKENELIKSLEVQNKGHSNAYLRDGAITFSAKNARISQTEGEGRV